SAVGLTGAAAQTKAKATVAQRLDWLGSKFDPNDVTVDLPAPCVGGSGTCITVKISYPWEDKPLVPAAPGLGFVAVEHIASEATVQIS
ncbi:MAG TPA: hypothetical protein VF244_00695, partial [Acidimicrobiales bacterium]